MCPDNRITADTVVRRGTKRAENRAATALRHDRHSLWHSKTYLGAKLRRLRV